MQYASNDCKFENAQKYWELINANVIFNNIESKCPIHFKAPLII